MDIVDAYFQWNFDILSLVTKGATILLVIALVINILNGRIPKWLKAQQW